MDRERKLLLACCSSLDDSETWRESRRILSEGSLNWDFFLREAAFHGLSSLIRYRWRKCEFMRFSPPAVADKLEKAFYAGVRDNLKLSAELDFLEGVFKRGQTEAIVLKGPVLDRCVYPRRGLRTYSDLDLLCAEKDLNKISDFLSAEGYGAPEVYFSEKKFRRFHFEIPLVNRDKGILLEIHWDLLPPWRPHSSRITGVWSEKEALKENSPFFFLGLEDMIIHLTAHIDLHAYQNRYRFSSPEGREYLFNRESGNRIIWFADLYELIRGKKEKIDWPGLWGKCVRWGVRSAVFGNLSLLNDVFLKGELDEELEEGALTFGKVKRKIARAAEKGDKVFKTRLGERLSFRRTPKFADILEYLFPGKESVLAFYDHGKNPTIARLSYTARSLSGLLKMAVFFR